VPYWTHSRPPFSAILDPFKAPFQCHIGPIQGPLSVPYWTERAKANNPVKVEEVNNDNDKT